MSDKMVPKANDEPQLDKRNGIFKIRIPIMCLKTAKDMDLDIKGILTKALEVAILTEFGYTGAVDCTPEERKDLIVARLKENESERRAREEKARVNAVEDKRQIHEYKMFCRVNNLNENTITKNLLGNGDYTYAQYQDLLFKLESHFKKNNVVIDMVRLLPRIKIEMEEDENRRLPLVFKAFCIEKGIDETLMKAFVIGERSERFKPWEVWEDHESYLINRLSINKLPKDLNRLRVLLKKEK